MGKLYPELDQRLRKFIARQPVFFVATAPCLTGEGDGGHVNVSPKGLQDTFAILGPTTVAYLDLTGSGAETIAHLRQNGQITIMFCSFEQQPKILRLYGVGAVVLPGEPQWGELAGHFPGAGSDRLSRRPASLSAREAPPPPASSRKSKKRRRPPLTRLQQNERGLRKSRPTSKGRRRRRRRRRRRG